MTLSTREKEKTISQNQKANSIEEAVKRLQFTLWLEGRDDGCANTQGEHEAINLFWDWVRKNMTEDQAQEFISLIKR